MLSINCFRNLKERIKVMDFIKILIGLNGFKFENSIKNNFKIENVYTEVGFNIYQDNNYINELFDVHFLDNEDLDIETASSFTVTFGLEPLFGLKTYPYLYYYFEGTKPTDENLTKIYRKLASEVHLLLVAMWFVKDNSVSFKTILPYYEDFKSNPYFPRAYYNYTVPVLSNGKQCDTEFSLSDLKEVEKWYNLINNFMRNVKIKEYENDQPIYESYPNIPSYQRVINFIVSIRSDWTITSKIAGYVSILECILSVKGENTHKVSERVAWFIGENSIDRLKIYNTIKSAYNDRSNFIHGSAMKYDETSRAKREAMVTDLDELVRKVLKKCFQDYPYLNYGVNKRDNLALSDDVDQWFNKLVITGQIPEEIKIQSN